MIIDFEKIAEAHIEGFKGGEGKLDTRNYVDDRARIMYSTLRPGARSGEHRHEGTFEVIYVLSGELTFCYDGQEEVSLLPRGPHPRLRESHRPRRALPRHRPHLGIGEKGAERQKGRNDRKFFGVLSGKC